MLHVFSNFSNCKLLETRECLSTITDRNLVTAFCRLVISELDYDYQELDLYQSHIARYPLKLHFPYKVFFTKSVIDEKGHHLYNVFGNCTSFSTTSKQPLLFEMEERKVYTKMSLDVSQPRSTEAHVSVFLKKMEIHTHVCSALDERYPASGFPGRRRSVVQGQKFCHVNSLTNTITLCLFGLC